MECCNGWVSCNIELQRFDLAMTEFLLGHGRYLALIVVLVLTGAGLPLPEEVPVVAAGVLSAVGEMDPWLALGSCLIGALLGDSLMYWIGYRFGRGFIWAHPRWSRFLHAEREQQIERIIDAHGLKVFFLARFLVGVRAPMYIAAGVLKVPFRRFILMDLLCATVVIGTFFGLSYAYGEVIGKLIRDVEVVLTAIVVAAAIAVALFLWRRHRRKQARAGGPALLESPAEFPAEPRREGDDEEGEDAERVA